MEETRTTWEDFDEPALRKRGGDPVEAYLAYLSQRHVAVIR